MGVLWLIGGVGVRVWLDVRRCPLLVTESCNPTMLIIFTNAIHQLDTVVPPRVPLCFLVGRGLGSGCRFRRVEHFVPTEEVVLNFVLSGVKG